MWGGSACKLESPLGIAGSVLAWWDFSRADTLWTDDGSTPVSSDADAIYRVDDLSGNGYHLRQSTSSKRPAYRTGGSAYGQNGKSVARFDGTDDWLRRTDLCGLSGNTAVTILIALRTTNGQGSNAIFTLGSNPGTSGQVFGATFYPTTGTDAKPGWRWFNGYSNSNSALEGAQQVSWIHPASSVHSDSKIFRNSGELSLTDNNPSNTTSLPSAGTRSTVLGCSFNGVSEDVSSSPFRGEVFEVLLFGADLPTYDRRRGENYLMAKWGIQA